MRKLNIGVLDLGTNAPTRQLYARTMNSNFAGIMPQIVAVWCEEQGHKVFYSQYTGSEDIPEILKHEFDLVFVSAFTRSGLLSYAISNQLRKLGVVTVLGGPHASCYPEDAQKYFDYVLGFTDKNLIFDLLKDYAPQRPLGLHLATDKQPTDLPGVRRRWKFIEMNLRKAPLIKVVPMLGSLGCPYACSFCIDAEVPYQPLDFDVLKEDFRFLLGKLKRPVVGWYDPNFGVRFNDYMNAIEESIPANSIDFIAESSLSLLTEPHVKRMQRNGFVALLPGIESWYDMGNKSKTGSKTGMDKVRLVSEQVNMIQKYIPYVQTNFIVGLDTDEGDEPFELTKQFLAMTPGTFPTFPILTSYGRAAPMNMEYQIAGRVLPVPLHLLNNNHAMNVRPVNYSWPELYDHLLDVSKFAYSKYAVLKRFNTNSGIRTRWMNVLRAVSSEGRGRIKYYTEVRKRLDNDKPFRAYMEQDSVDLPEFFESRIRKDLGTFWDWLPQGGLQHDAYAYLGSRQEKTVLRN